MASTDIQHVEVPDRLLPIVGDPDPGTRMYRRYGTEQDFQQWWDAVCEVCGPTGSVSPGGVSMYARVSRAGVHKRMREGRITAFLFHVVKGFSRWTKREILDHAGMPYIFIPCVECSSWAELLGTKDRSEQRREAVGDGDDSDEFLKAEGRKLKKGEKA